MAVFLAVAKDGNTPLLTLIEWIRPLGTLNQVRTINPIADEMLMLKVPRNALPMGVWAVERMTISFILSFLLGRGSACRGTSERLRCREEKVYVAPSC